MDIVGGLAPTNDEQFRAGVDDEQGVATDDELTDAVRRALLSDGNTSGMDVQVLVANGIVTLRGNVDHIDDAEAAQAVASMVPGVIDVQEELPGRRPVTVRLAVRLAPRRPD
jgi:osmotically-inducible protein OsmY